MLRRSLEISSWTTSLSVGLNGFFSAIAGSVLFSMSRSMSISILVAPQFGRGRFVDQLSNHRLALGDLPAFAVLGNRHLLVERRGQKRRQVFRWPTAGVPGLPFLEAGVNRRLAVVRRVFTLGFGHVALSDFLPIYQLYRNC